MLTLSRSLVITFFTGLTNLLCRIDKSHLDRVPAKGPLILVTNHVNILEVPLVYVHLQPRPVTGFTLATRWDAAWTRWILNAVDAIPLRSGEADYKAMREAIQRLAAGEIVGVAPEGTRSLNGNCKKHMLGLCYWRCTVARLYNLWSFTVMKVSRILSAICSVLISTSVSGRHFT